VIFAFATQITHRFGSILDDVQRGMCMRPSHCRFKKECVLRRIFNHKNLQLMPRSHPKPSFASCKLNRVGIHPTRISAGNTLPMGLWTRRLQNNGVNMDWRRSGRRAILLFLVHPGSTLEKWRVFSRPMMVSLHKSVSSEEPSHIE